MTRRNPHEGTILTEAPNQICGTDATATFTEAEGAVTVFAAIDHCTAECGGIHVVKRATRFEALEPIRQGAYRNTSPASPPAAPSICASVSVYMRDDFQCAIQFLGIEPSPAFVRQPEGNGCIERFFRTLKEQLLWIHRFRNLVELRAALFHDAIFSLKQRSQLIQWVRFLPACCPPRPERNN